MSFNGKMYAGSLDPIRSTESSDFRREARSSISATDMFDNAIAEDEIEAFIRYPAYIASISVRVGNVVPRIVRLLNCAR